MPIIDKLAKLGRKPKIVVLGSGGLSIGQAGEFDYSGTQAVKALLEEGIEVIVVNPNVATVQTNPQPGVKIYLYPVEPHWVEKVIAAERPDGIVAGFGGQTALTCLFGLDAAGVLEKYDVLNLGTSVRTLRITEDRALFAEQMTKINIPIAPSEAVATTEAAIRAARNLGYPVLIRAAYALGGLGSGRANNDGDVQLIVEAALIYSPQVLVEKSLHGWKEVEYEVMRDSQTNTITICNMENFDPLGIHTGDSIVVAPSQSLSDDEYQILRNAAITIVNSLAIIGECNVQFALSPDSLDYFVIEVNARLSRSSALASKATGYPIAYIAAKVVLGFDLLELKNPVTGITFAFFEPALDYVTVKVPRWDLTKFRGVSRQLGSTMKSVGEVMAIGRSFPEAMQKAIRMVTESGEGMSSFRLPSTAIGDLDRAVSEPTDHRLYNVMEALRRGRSIEQLHALSRIDKWFLAHLKTIVQYEIEIEALVSNAGAAKGGRADAIDESTIAAALRSVEPDAWRRWKLGGFSDEQIAGILARRILGCDSLQRRVVESASFLVRNARLQAGVRPVVKRIDTTGGEYPSPSNYLYLSYGGLFDDPLPDDGRAKRAVLLGSGTYRIGTSVEFDWCAVSCSRRLQSAGWRSVIVNCNPETVSTDYNSSDRLYFEELSLERILDICDIEKPTGVIASMGGQLPNRLALPLANAGVRLLGHSAETVDLAEDRSRFSRLLDDAGIDQPRWATATNVADVDAFVEKVGFPVLVRPSYVLSGAAMRVAYDHASLVEFLGLAVEVSTDHPVVLSEFLEGAREVELDGVAKDGEVITAIVSEHIENAGVHSGDATTVVPAQRLYVETVRRVRRAGRLIARGLKLNGPFNMQFLAVSNHIRVIECNARAARSFPFVSKVVGVNLAEVATDVIIGEPARLPRVSEDDIPHVGIKAAMFSFARLSGADPILGVEMASTGEVGCIGHDFEEAILLSLEAAHVRPPQRGVLVSAGPEREKLKFLPCARFLVELGIKIYATTGTARYLQAHGIECEATSWPGAGNPDVIHLIRERLVDMVVNVPKDQNTRELTHGAEIRAAAIRYGCSLLTNMEKTAAFFGALTFKRDFRAQHDVLRLPEFRNS